MSDEWLDNLLEEIHEAKQASTSRVSRGAKISRATGSLAISKAKQENDPDYKQMKKYLDLYRKHKQKIIKKYGPKVRSQARK